MSSDLLEDIKDEDGTSVLLEMDVCNFAFLSIIEVHKYETEAKSAQFNLTPDNNGLDNAEKIAKALLAWRDHVITINSLVK
jgi:hypothetical protein